MRNHLRRYAIGALTLGTLAGAAAVALPASAATVLPAPAVTWHPATYGLTATPAQLLPANVSLAHPVRIVSTRLDQSGRPVVTSTMATSAPDAAALVRNGQKAENAVGVELDATVTATAVPTGTDPYRSMQWDFTKLKVADAWQKSTGAGVTVAVIDTGVEAGHPDLAGHVLAGKDMITGTTGVSSDPNGHGTHVAGTIAALTGNGVGVSAIAPDAKILPVRVLGANGSGVMSDTANGIVWAADHGANVINMSLGSPSQVGAVTTAIAYARSKGVTVIAAAGNDREKGSPISYPAADPGVIAVAATDSNDAVAGFSNKGSYVDVAAPGVSVANTYPVSKGSYVYMSGTSMAAPHVAAVAALLKAYNPALAPDGIEQALESTAVDLGTKGKDTDFGYGRIDPVAALNAAKPAAPAGKTTPAITTTTSATSVVYGTTVTVSYGVTAAGKALAGKPVRIGVAVNGGGYTYTDATTGANGTVAVSKQATGPFQVRLVVPATDTTLETSSAAVSVTVRAKAAVTSPKKGALKVALTGAVGQTVKVQRLDHGRWVTAGTYKATTKAHTQTRLTTGTTYRVIVPSSAGVTGLTSASAKIS